MQICEDGDVKCNGITCSVYRMHEYNKCNHIGNKRTIKYEIFNLIKNL